jgi:hypothetical protein
MFRVFNGCFQCIGVSLLLLRGALSASLAAEAIVAKKAPDSRPAPSFEAYSGLDYATRGAALYSMAIWSPFGSVSEPGLRLRVDSLASIYGRGKENIFSTAFLPGDAKTVGAIMLGYQLNRGPLWLKFYGGAVHETHAMMFWEAVAAPVTQSWGAKVAVESWLRAGDRSWISANLSWAQPHNEVSLFSRAGYEALRFDAGVLSIGGEATGSVNGVDFFDRGGHLNRFHDVLRGGGFLDLRYGSHDILLSGGWEQGRRDNSPHPYATLTYGKKF